MASIFYTRPPSTSSSAGATADATGGNVPPDCTSWSPSSGAIVLVDCGKTVKFCDALSHDEVLGSYKNTYDVRPVQYCPRSNKILALVDDGSERLAVWNLSTNGLRILSGASKHQLVCINSAGTRLITYRTTSDYAVMWDLETGSELFRLDKEAHAHIHFCFTVDDSRIVFEEIDEQGIMSVNVWGADADEPLLTVVLPPSVLVQCKGVSSSSNSQLIGVWTEGEIYVFDINTGIVSLHLAKDCLEFCFGCDDTCIIIIFHDHSCTRTHIEAYRIEDGSLLYGLIHRVEFSGGILRVLPGPSSVYIFGMTCYKDDLVCEFDSASGQMRRSVTKVAKSDNNVLTDIYLAIPTSILL
jgi:hypothetical protein